MKDDYSIEAQPLVDTIECLLKSSRQIMDAIDRMTAEADLSARLVYGPTLRRRGSENSNESDLQSIP
jgi:hypothetical protein